MNDIIDRLSCYIDLHLHLDGALSENCARQLADMQGIEVPPDRAGYDKLTRVPDDCTSLTEYLKKYDFPLTLLQTEEALRLAVFSVLNDLKERGLIYAELRFAPQLHTLKGMTADRAVDAVIDGMKRSGMPSNLILCLMRGKDNHKENMETVELGAQYLEKGVCCLDLAGAEAIYPTESFRDCFEYARMLGVPFVIHAGEAAGAESVDTAVSFGALRIGHGVNAAKSKATMRRLSENGIFMELCFSSNLQTKAVARKEDWPIRTFMDNGIRVTVNTDGPAPSGTDIRREWRKITETFSLSADEIKEILFNSADAAFVGEQERADMKQSIREDFEKL